MVRHKAETFEPVTMGHIRGHGCRDLLVYCNSGRCHHSATECGSGEDHFALVPAGWLERLRIERRGWSGMTHDPMRQADISARQARKRRHQHCL
jgi:hypothetical protein